MLLLEFGLSLYVLLLELGYEVVPELHLVSRIEVFCFGRSGLERIGIPLLFKDDDLLVEFLNLFFLAKELVLLLFDEFLLPKNLLNNLLVVGIRSLQLFFVHVPVPLQLFNKTLVLPLTFLLIIDLALKLSQGLIDSISQLLLDLSLVLKFRFFVLQVLYLPDLVFVLVTLSFQLVSESVQILFLDLHEGVEMAVDLFDLGNLLFLDILLFLQPFQQLLLLLGLNLKFVSLSSELFKFIL